MAAAPCAPSCLSLSILVQAGAAARADQAGRASWQLGVRRAVGGWHAWLPRLASAARLRQPWSMVGWSGAVAQLRYNPLALPQGWKDAIFYIDLCMTCNHLLRFHVTSSAAAAADCHGGCPATRWPLGCRWDNATHDLIVAVGDEFVSTLGTRCAAAARRACVVQIQSCSSICSCGCISDGSEASGICDLPPPVASYALPS